VKEGESATASKASSPAKEAGASAAPVIEPAPIERKLLDSRAAEARAADSRAIDAPAPDTQTLNISIDLPVTVHAAPADEAALAIHDVTINPGLIDPAQPGTTSITVIAVPEAPADSAKADTRVVPELPVGDAPQSRRERLRGEPATSPESSAMLTADRLIDGRKKKRTPPEGGWSRFVYNGSLHAINLGDSQRVREHKAMDVRISKSFEGGTRFIPVLTRKGGVGKTTVTALLGMALASVRDDRVIAIDANPDRGTLAERVNKQTRSTVRDVVTHAAAIGTFNDFSEFVSRDETRLDILASDTDPLLSEAFDEDDYNVVADLTARYYSMVLTDCGTGIVHSVMRATLQRADSVVIVSGGSVDEARLASETLTWLEANGYGALVSNAIVALNTATQGTNLVKLEEIEAHFISRVRDVVKIPYDPQLAAGSVVSYRDLKPLTQNSARELAALVVDGLPARREI
jgi:MinD-like ATPase involved in chromosome partitioning or flagellar assembly